MLSYKWRFVSPKSASFSARLEGRIVLNAGAVVQEEHVCISVEHVIPKYCALAAAVEMLDPGVSKQRGGQRPQHCAQTYLDDSQN